jgi:hypothetical protein
MQKNFNQQAGTAGGQASISLGPDGQATMGKSEGRLAGGSTITSTFVDVGGPGKDNVDGAWGKASFESDGRGGYTLTSASINGQAPMSLAQQNANILTEKASHALGTNQSWDKLVNQSQTNGLTSREEQTYVANLQNSASAKINKALNSGSSFKDSVGEDTQAALSAFAEASGGIKVLGIDATGGGKYAVTATGNNGKTVSFDVDQKTSEAVGSEITRSRSEAIQEAMGNAQGLQHATSLANKIGATEAASYMKDASNMSRTTETTGADATTAFVRWYANDRGFGGNPEGIEAAGKELNHWATNSGASGLQTLHAHEQRFLKSGDYTWGDGKAQAEAQVSATKAEVVGGMGSVQSQVMPAANEAGARTQNITHGDFSGHPTNRHPKLVGPEESANRVQDVMDKRLKEHQDAKLMGANGALVDNLTGINIPAGIKNIANGSTNKKVVTPEDTSEPSGGFSGP